MRTKVLDKQHTTSLLDIHRTRQITRLYSSGIHRSREQRCGCQAVAAPSLQKRSKSSAKVEKSKRLAGGNSSGRQKGGLAQQTLPENRSLTKREKQRAENDVPQRLAKIIAQAGVASRRASEDLVVAGVVKVNSQVIRVPQHKVLPSVDKIVVNGKPLPRSAQKYYFALNKPKGYLCANRGTDDAERQHLVVDLFKQWIEREWRPRHTHPNAVPPRLFTVGRLDVQTTGLIFVTNDGEWAQKVQHPSSNITKEYVVTLTKPPTSKQIEDIASGCVVDGAFVHPRSLAYAVVGRRDKLRVVVGEGRNREVRVLMENAGLEVKGLKRVRIGGFRLPKDLSIGEFRELKTYVMKRVLNRSIEMNPQTNPVLTLASDLTL